LQEEQLTNRSTSYFGANRSSL